MATPGRKMTKRRRRALMIAWDREDNRYEERARQGWLLAGAPGVTLVGATHYVLQDADRRPICEVSERAIIRARERWWSARFRRAWSGYSGQTVWLDEVNQLAG